MVNLTRQRTSRPHLDHVMIQPLQACIACLIRPQRILWKSRGQLIVSPNNGRHSRVDVPDQPSTNAHGPWQQAAGGVAGQKQQTD
ncbi:hypothetical protein GW17_00048171 [Ensete ventricosum]|nr:hypothetical protein GW17_00048171 [Ensete ventricosum]